MKGHWNRQVSVLESYAVLWGKILRVWRESVTIEWLIPLWIYLSSLEVVFLCFRLYCIRSTQLVLCNFYSSDGAGITLRIADVFPRIRVFVKHVNEVEIAAMVWFLYMVDFKIARSGELNKLHVEEENIMILSFSSRLLILIRNSFSIGVWLLFSGCLSFFGGSYVFDLTWRRANIDCLV